MMAIGIFEMADMTFPCNGLCFLVLIYLKVLVSVWSAEKDAIVVIIENSQMAVTSTKFWNFYDHHKNIQSLYYEKQYDS